MIDHLSLPVADMQRACAFYDAVLGALGFKRLSDQAYDDYTASGYGAAGGHEPPFWIGAAEPPTPVGPLPVGQHVAFTAPSRAAVDAFHAAALTKGGKCNGAPGLRPHYHPNYYAAFVICPDGHHLEAVRHAPE